MRLWLAALLLAACDSENDVQRCTLDTQCSAPDVCSAPAATDAGPLPGTCRQPASEGGLCYRNADCLAPLVCAIADPTAPFAAGDCETAGEADAHVTGDAGSEDADTADLDGGGPI